MKEDPSEWAVVFDAVGPQLRRFLLGVTKDVHAAEDAAQAAIAKALERPVIEPMEAAKAWLFKVALNEALANRRRDGRFKAAVRNLTWLRAPERSSQGRTEEKEEAARVRREIDKLPPEQKLVVRKRLFEEKTFVEIAKEEVLPIGTVLTRMRLALERLRKRLGDGN